jgi:hypothetical protein
MMDWIDISEIKRSGNLPASWTLYSVQTHLGAKDLAACSDEILITAFSNELARGEIVAVRDHVNVSGFNPLRGHNDDVYGVRFPDMSHPYALIPSVKKTVLIRAGEQTEHPIDAVRADEVVFQVILAKHQEKKVYALLYGKGVSADQIINLFQGE